VLVRIPALSVDAEIQGTYFDETETMEIVPSASIISWLKEGPIPGNDGNAILGGHNRWNGITGQLFYLDELEIGDEMEIGYADGSSLTFRLESVFVYPLATADADSIMDLEGDARVTVITCKDPFNTYTGTSDNRIIAVFKEASVFVIPDPPIEPWPLINPDTAPATLAVPGAGSAPAPAALPQAGP
jgi:sortase (surface protein transpeptidase)